MERLFFQSTERMNNCLKGTTIQSGQLFHSNQRYLCNERFHEMPGVVRERNNRFNIIFFFTNIKKEWYLHPQYTTKNLADLKRGQVVVAETAETASVRFGDTVDWPRGLVRSRVLPYSWLA